MARAQEFRQLTKSAPALPPGAACADCDELVADQVAAEETAGGLSEAPGVVCAIEGSTGREKPFAETSLRKRSVHAASGTEKKTDGRD